MKKEHFDYIRETLTWFFGQGVVVTPKENGQAGTGVADDKKASENGSAVY